MTHSLAILGDQMTVIAFFLTRWFPIAAEAFAIPARGVVSRERETELGLKFMTAS